jgi:hypothetical protein
MVIGVIIHGVMHHEPGTSSTLAVMSSSKPARVCGAQSGPYG